MHQFQYVTKADQLTLTTKSPPLLTLPTQLPCLLNNPTLHLRVYMYVFLCVPSLQLGTVTLAGCLVGKSCLSRVACRVSVRAIAAEGRQARVCVPCYACVSTAGEARHRRVYNTQEVCYTC